jgi:hypothetical protein
MQGNLTSIVIGAMVFSDRSWALSPSWRAFVDVVSSDICDEDWKKHDYVRSILKKVQQGLDWVRPSERVIDLRPISLYYAVKK